MRYCKECNEPVVFMLLVGWTHVTFAQFDHDVEI